ncbi:MAG: hypothetical protein ABL973_20235 [Micropepsaceae bacterium]
MTKTLTLTALGLVAAIAATALIGPSVADSDKKVKIINETRHKIVHFYASRVGADNWEEDILGEDVLEVGGSVKVNFGTSEYCLYDFRAVFNDGDKVEKYRINVCEIDTYRYTED